MFYLLICLSGLGSVTHGYHYPTPPTRFHMPNAPSFGYYGPGSQTGFQHSPWQTQWKYEWNKPSGNAYGSSEMGSSEMGSSEMGSSEMESSEVGHNRASEMLPTSDFASNPDDNSQAVPKRTNTSKRTTENEPLDHIKKIFTTTTPDPADLQRPLPEPGTLSDPVPKLGDLFAPSLQWHVGIYSKRFTPYMQVCGGSLVRPDVVLTAAHCFWDDEVGVLREGLFAVAAGKLLRPWQTEEEVFTQQSDIKEIKIPPRFQGAKTSFQDDIAIVFLSSALQFAPGVKPICLSFDQDTERRLLKSGNLGTIAGWGLTTPNGPPSQRLNYLELPYVDIQECIRTAEPSFLKYITSDKICAGDKKTGRALCKGDSGGGLTYYSNGVPYLVGIASVALRDENECNAYAVGTFTYTRAHSAFLQEHVPMIGEGCEGLYSNATGQNETIAGVTQNPTIEEVKVYIPQLGEDVPMPALITDETTPNIVTNNGGIMETVTKDQKMDTTDRTPIKLVTKPVTDEKMVMMSVESGEQSVVRVPVQGASTLVCNCYCKN